MNKIILVQGDEEIETTNVTGVKIEWLGINSTLKIWAPMKFSNCTIQIGTNDLIEIRENSNISNTFLRCASSNSTIKIGKNFIMVGGKIILPNAHENQYLTIGNDCLFSFDIFIQTADGHTLLNLEGDVLNLFNGGIYIGNHVWVGHGVSILKRATVPDDTVVAESAVVCNCFSEKNCVLGGVPAKVIKTGVTWNIKLPRIYLKENCKNDSETDL